MFHEQDSKARLGGYNQTEFSELQLFEDLCLIAHWSCGLYDWFDFTLLTNFFLALCIFPGSEDGGDFILLF